MGRHSHPPIMAVKLIALVVLVFSGKSDANEEIENSLDRQGFSLSTNCEDSEPFFIKNEKKRQSYLTADLETNAVKAWTKTGEENQQWMWSRCESAVHLKNVATGGCLTIEGVLSECRDLVYWEHRDDGTLFVWGWGTVDVCGPDGKDCVELLQNALGYARFYKRKTALQIVQEVKYKVTCGDQPCETEVPWAWFRWAFENVE